MASFDPTLDSDPFDVETGDASLPLLHVRWRRVCLEERPSLEYATEVYAVQGKPVPFYVPAYYLPGQYEHPIFRQAFGEVSTPLPRAHPAHLMDLRIHSRDKTVAHLTSLLQGNCTAAYVLQRNHTPVSLVYAHPSIQVPSTPVFGDCQPIWVGTLMTALDDHIDRELHLVMSRPAVDIKVQKVDENTYAWASLTTV